MIASRAGHDDVVLPASNVRYSVEESARLVGALDPHPYFEPGRGPPGSAELEALLHLYHLSGLPMVGVGRRWGPKVPQLREPSEKAADLSAIDKDMEVVANQRWPWAQPWYPEAVTIENRDEVLQRAGRWRPETKRGVRATKWRPCTHVAICMWASSARHLHGQGDDQIMELLEAKDPRTARKAIDIGNRTWAELGGWPWATWESGALKADWWTSDDVWNGLEREIDGRVRVARRLAESLADHGRPASATRQSSVPR